MVLKPLETLEQALKQNDNRVSCDFWENIYNGIGRRSYSTFKSVPFSEIELSFDKYCDRILKKNNLGLMKIFRAIRFLGFFQPVNIFIPDKKFTVQVDYVEKRLVRTNQAAHLSVESEPLHFLFNNTFGFDTLTVNGCFEEGQGRLYPSFKVISN